MGAGKGKTRRRQVLAMEQWSKTPVFSADNTLRVVVEGQKFTEPGQFYPCDHAELWVSDEYESPVEIAAEVGGMLSKAPKCLSAVVKRVSVMGNYAPKRKGFEGFTGAACAEEQDIMVWRVQANNDMPGLRQDILEHELAHVAGTDGGPPEELRKAWARARKKDKKYGSKIATLINRGRASKGELKVGGIRFLFGEPWITARVEDAEAQVKHGGDNEDWAETVSYYLNFQRLPNQTLKAFGRDLTFAELYPHRARLVEKFLG